MVLWLSTIDEQFQAIGLSFICQLFLIFFKIVQCLIFVLLRVGKCVASDHGHLESKKNGTLYWNDVWGTLSTVV